MPTPRPTLTDAVPRVAAEPDALLRYGQRALLLDHELSLVRRRLASCATVDLGPIGVAAVGELVADLDRLAVREAATGRWVAAVGQAFALADQAAGGVGGRGGAAIADAYVSLASDRDDPDVVALAVASLVAARFGPEAVAGAALTLGPVALAGLVRAHPELVGPVDGMPVAARYEANRLLVQRGLADEADPVRRAALRRLLRADPATGRPRQLLFVDPAGDGRVAEVFGDLTVAGSVAVVVPGVDTDLTSFDRHLARPSGALGRRAGPLAPDGVAVVAWLGYDPPDGLAVDPRELGAVIGTDRARTGGRALVDLLDGLPDRPGRQVTLVGHSYGSTTVAAALLVGAEPQRVVVLGSPGVLVDRAEDFDRPATSFWVLAAPGDAVAGLARLGWFGGDPARPGSGFTRLAADGVGHSRYLEVGSVSQANVAAVIAGAPTTASRPPP